MAPREAQSTSLRLLWSLLDFPACCSAIRWEQRRAASISANTHKLFSATGLLLPKSLIAYNLLHR